MSVSSGNNEFKLQVCQYVHDLLKVPSLAKLQIT